MKANWTTGLLGLVVVLGACTLLLPLGRAEDDTKGKTVTKSDTKTPAPESTGSDVLSEGASPESELDRLADEPPASLKDAAFDRFVDLTLLREALQSRDAAQLADVGLLLAEGERVLGRSHKAMKAESVLQFAARMAAENRDAKLLERLSKASAVAARADLAAQIEGLKKVAATRRSITAPLMIDLTKADEATVTLLQSLVKEIRAAQAIGDRETLVGIEAGLGELKELEDGHRSALKKLVAAAMPVEEKESSEQEVLRKLAGPSRDLWGDLADTVKGTSKKLFSDRYLVLKNVATQPLQVTVRLYRSRSKDWVSSSFRMERGQTFNPLRLSIKTDGPVLVNGSGIVTVSAKGLKTGATWKQKTLSCSAYSDRSRGNYEYTLRD